MRAQLAPGAVRECTARLQPRSRHERPPGAASDIVLGIAADLGSLLPLPERPIGDKAIGRGRSVRMLEPVLSAKRSALQVNIAPHLCQ